MEEDPEWTVKDSLETDDEGEDTVVAAEYALVCMVQEAWTDLDLH